VSICLKGCAPRCAVCGQTKKPRGRDGGMWNSGCNADCEGYYNAPSPCDLWPGETREEFGYPLNWRELADKGEIK